MKINICFSKCQNIWDADGGRVLMKQSWHLTCFSFGIAQCVHDCKHDIVLRHVTFKQPVGLLGLM